MQPELSTWQQPKRSSWSQCNKGQAQQQSPAGQRVSVKLSGCSDAVPPVPVTMQDFKVGWKTKKPQKWESSASSFHARASDAFFFFFQSGFLVLCLYCHPSKWVTEHTENPWTADVWQIILPNQPRAQLLLHEIIKHCLVLFSQCSQEGD